MLKSKEQIRNEGEMPGRCTECGGAIYGFRNSGDYTESGEAESGWCCSVCGYRVVTEKGSEGAGE